MCNYFPEYTCIFFDFVLKWIVSKRKRRIRSWHTKLQMPASVVVHVLLIAQLELSLREMHILKLMQTLAWTVAHALLHALQVQLKTNVGDFPVN